MLSVMAPTQRQLESVQWIVARLSVIMPIVTAHKSVNDEEKKFYQFWNSVLFQRSVVRYYRRPVANVIKLFTAAIMSLLA